MPLPPGNADSRLEPKARWKFFADRAKHNRLALRLADRLGRGQGKLRLLDRLGSRCIPPAPLTPDLSDWTSRHASAVWLGHASILFRLAGLTVLTDPVFSDRVGIGLGLATAGPRRLTALPLPPDKLPAADLILLSHAHFDHLDRPTLARLPKSARVLISAGNRDLVDDLGFADVTELAVGDSHKVGGVGGVGQAGALRITAIPVQHWGARVFNDTHRGYCAYLLETATHRILFGADTAYQEHWKAFAPVDLCCVGIGAYDPWVAAHATPEQAAEMARHAGARLVLPMHHRTFKLSHEPLADPLRRLKLALPPERLALTDIGGQWTE